VNGDGYDDMLVGSNPNAGVVGLTYLIFGHAGTTFGPTQDADGRQTYDIAAMQTIIGTDSDNATINPALRGVVTLAAGDTFANVTVRITLDGGEDQAVSLNTTTGEWTYTPPTTGTDALSVGYHTIAITQTDIAGNSSTENYTVYYGADQPPAGGAGGGGTGRLASAGEESISGTDGDDVLELTDPSASVDGGAGFDTLLVSGSGLSLNLDNVAGVEQIDLREQANGNGGNTLNLTLADVLRLPDATPGELQLTGDASNTVNLLASDGFERQGAQQIDGTFFDIYTADTATLLIEQGLVVQQV
jgi:hypothetical protein